MRSPTCSWHSTARVAQTARVDPARLLGRPDAEEQEGRRERDRVEVEQRRVQSPAPSGRARPRPPRGGRRRASGARARRRGRSQRDDHGLGHEQHLGARPHHPERREERQHRVDVGAEPVELDAQTSVVSRKCRWAVLHTAWTMFPRSSGPSRSRGSAAPRARRRARPTPGPGRRRPARRGRRAAAAAAPGSVGAGSTPGRRREPVSSRSCSSVMGRAATRLPGAATAHLETPAGL